MTDEYTTVSAASRLRAFLDAQGLSLRKAGRIVGCSGPHMYRLTTGQMLPGRALANRIAAATEGWEHGPILSTEWDAEEA